MMTLPRYLYSIFEIKISWDSLGQFGTVWEWWDSLTVVFRIFFEDVSRKIKTRRPDPIPVPVHAHKRPKGIFEAMKRNGAKLPGKIEKIRKSKKFPKLSQSVPNCPKLYQEQHFQFSSAAYMIAASVENTKCASVQTPDNENSLATSVQLHRTGSPAFPTKSQLGIWTVWDSLDSLGQFRSDLYSHTKY